MEDMNAPSKSMVMKKRTKKTGMRERKMSLNKALLKKTEITVETTMRIRWKWDNDYFVLLDAAFLM